MSLLIWKTGSSTRSGKTFNKRSLLANFGTVTKLSYLISLGLVQIQNNKLMGWFW